jgi:hypothetical protein
MMNHKVISSIASLEFGNCELSATTKHQHWMPPLSAQGLRRFFDRPGDRPAQLHSPALGQHPNNEWPGEPSVLILKLNRESAKVLAMQYEQHAFVWAVETAVPELVQR